MLNIRAAEPHKYALMLLDALFTDEEMASSCYAASKRSEKPELDRTRIRLLEGMRWFTYTHTCIYYIHVYMYIYI